MSKEAHCPPHKPRWNIREFLFGARIFEPSRGVHCAHCDETIYLARARAHQQRRTLAMIVLSIVLAFYQYSPNRWMNLLIGLIVITLANALLYYGYALCLYCFGKFVPIPKPEA